MRIIVMSDSHKYYPAVQKIMIAQPDADMYIHLGDGEYECDRLKTEYPDKQFFFLKGNCDLSADLPDFLIIPVGINHRILATHGHKYDVKYTTNRILEAALQNNCDIALFGHTHSRYCGYQDGVHILNPGSCFIPRDGQSPSYAFVDIVSGGIEKNIISL